MTDRDIVELFYARDEQAIAVAQEQYGGYCHAVAIRILNSEEDTAECVNDALLKAWDSIPPHRPDCLKTYLAKLTRNTAVDRYRTHHADKRGGGETALVIEELQECLPSSEESVIDRVALKDLLERFLTSLSATERRVFLRRYWYARSIKDIAREGGMTENNVKVTLHRSRRKLTTYLKKEGIDL